MPLEAPVTHRVLQVSLTCGVISFQPWLGSKNLQMDAVTALFIYLKFYFGIVHMSVLNVYSVKRC